MGWIAIYRKDGHIVREEDGLGRPVDAGNNNELIVIAQEDFGHKVAVDLTNGIIALEYDHLGIQNELIELHSPKALFWICEETSIVGEFKHVEATFQQWYTCGVDGCDDQGSVSRTKCKNKHIRKAMYHNNEKVNVRTDILHPIIWRPIWFTRMTNGVPTKVIGAQTTTPEDMGSRNVKKLVSIFADGRLGVD